MSIVAFLPDRKIEVTIQQEDIQQGYFEFTYRSGKHRRVTISPKTCRGSVWVCWEKKEYET